MLPGLNCTFDRLPGPLPVSRAQLTRKSWKAAASLARSVARIEAAPARQPFPHREPRPGAVLGRLVFLRRTSEAGIVSILGHRFPVSPDWPHRLVRGELDIDARRLRFFALRRREPTLQPLLSELPYQPPVRWSR